MDYIAFMHRNEQTPSGKEEWDHFFEIAKASGLFRGGSAIGDRSVVGNQDVPNTTINIGGFMRFESETLEALNTLLQHHPGVKHGGSVEVCELPKTP